MGRTLHRPWFHQAEGNASMQTMTCMREAALSIISRHFTFL